MSHRPRRDSHDDSQARGAPPADAATTLNDRAVAAARAELRGERTAILGATGRLSLPRLEPPRRVPERWTFVSVAGQITLRMYIGTTWVPMMVADTSTGAIIDDPLSPKNWVVASGTHDAITASYDPPVTTLVDGMVLSFRATSANLTATPTFNPNGLGAATITKLGGSQVWGGDIPGNLAEVSLRYNAANTRWEIISPIFSVPVCGIVPFFSGFLPSGFVLPQGQNLSTATYPVASELLGTTYGNPGGGNFTMPDLRGRFFFNLDAGGSGRITSAGGNFDGTVLGNTGGAQNRTVAQTNLPNVNFAVSGITLSTANGNLLGNWSTGTVAFGATAFSMVAVQEANGNLSSLANLTSNVTTSITSQGAAASGGSGTALATLPPAMGVNCMMRIA